MRALPWRSMCSRIASPRGASRFFAAKGITAVTDSWRRLHERGKKVQVILLANPADLRGDAAVMFGKLLAAAVAVHSSEQLKNERVLSSMHADLYLDAILGTGFKPPVSGLYADAIAIMSASHVPVIAVDIPSGADADAMRPQTGTIP